MSLTVLLLEDDYQQRRDLQNVIESEVRAKVITQSSESEFVTAFESIASDPPALAILDVMVRWTNPTREPVEAPEEAKQPETAGLRCARKLRHDPRTKDVKVILYSVLPKEDLGEGEIPPDVTSVVKETDFEDLLEAIRDALPANP